MMGDLGKSQLSSLLEAVPGLASVLRSPVADAIMNMVRAGAGLRAFDIHDAEELVQYATRRGLIPSSEGEDLLEEVRLASESREAKPIRVKTRAPKKPVAKAAKKNKTKKTSQAAKKSGGSPVSKRSAKKGARKTSKRRH